MKKVIQKTPLSIQIIYVLTSIVYYLTIITSSFGIIFAIGLFFGLWGDDLNLHSQMPFEANVLETGTAMYWGQNIQLELVEASGKFHYIDTPLIVARTNAVAMFGIFPLIFFVVFLFHRFIRNVSEGKIFDAQNFYLLRKLSYVLAGMWLFTIFYFQLLQRAVFSELSFENLEFSNSGGWYSGLIMAALFTWVLSHIFLKGLELKEENELTI
jgi:hypothetical protein